MDLGCGPGFFSLAMAKLVGENGKVISVKVISVKVISVKVISVKVISVKVISVDVQDEMLQILKCKSEREGLSSRIVLHKISFKGF
ncbi:class I SAM-dependent methyltransferase [Methanosarcina barkeri]|uniref:SAM-dependent methyltransferase n=1 Tax=Methanosarcina barkeri CM1 TaxID=796385 RepID=A0A0G3C5Q9_METBA|nr:class I SAM-dependent methyltransferase [Methanosarcina barkeri]AKJ37324.1 SAM-dependent methyltransferase [Methanosarcina barkeri CM1]